MCTTMHMYHPCMHACLHAPAIKGTTVLSTQQVHKTDSLTLHTHIITTYYLIHYVYMKALCTVSYVATYSYKAHDASYIIIYAKL